MHAIVRRQRGGTRAANAGFMTTQRTTQNDHDRSDAHFADGDDASLREGTKDEKTRAVALVRALAEASRHHDPIEAERAGRTVLLTSRIVPEYFVIRDAATLLAPVQGAPARALVAAPVGGVRLIDNAPWPGFSIEATPQQEPGL
jgi:hypothetical protein